MKRQFLAGILSLLLVLLAGCAEKTPLQTGHEIELVIASDLHYLSPALTDQGALFQQVAAQGDGKLMLYIDEITEAFVSEMLERRPACVILSGDLSYNGEEQSLIDLADKLRRLEEGGVTVLVMPGNHDISSPYSFSFSGEDAARVKNVNADEFREIFKSFGYDGAISVDPVSHSYVYALSSGLRVLMLDTNSSIQNFFPEKSLSWLEKQLRAAQKAGARVLAVSHQNLYLHNEQFPVGYRISNAAELLRLYREYGVMANLSGHMHIQHAVMDELPEVLTAGLAVSPCRYGLLIFDGESLRYEAQSLSLDDWAARSAQTDPALLQLSQTAEASFYQHFYRQIMEGYRDKGLPEESLARMADIFAKTNLAYFSGTELDRAALAGDLAFWAETAGDGRSLSYLKSILNDDAPSPLSLCLWRAGEK